MGRRILNRKDLRADFEAAERRGKEGEEEEVEDEEEKEEDEDEAESEEDEEAAGESDEEEGDEEAPPVKKKKAKPVKAAKVKVKAKTRSRTPKVTRMKVVWGVFNNSHQRVAVYDYPRRKDAEDHAAKLMNDKKSTHFVQPVKEPIEEKKEEKEK
jgi:hypothetical protein